MEKITRENFKRKLELHGFTVSGCGTCGIPKHKCYHTLHKGKRLEIWPTHLQYGSFAIYNGNAVVASGYLYDLHDSLEKHFPPASV
jgi:hypothetical protein